MEATNKIMVVITITRASFLKKAISHKLAAYGLTIHDLRSNLKEGTDRGTIFFGRCFLL